MVETGFGDTSLGVENKLLTYPCEGVKVGSLTMQKEDPNPLKSQELNRALGNSTAGQPILTSTHSLIKTLFMKINNAKVVGVCQIDNNKKHNKTFKFSS